MASFELPTSTTREAFTFQVDLEGVVYLFAFTWNARDEHWFMDLSDADGDPILVGRKVVVDTPLLKGVVDARRPPGGLMAFDTTGEGDPGLTEFGTRVLLIYQEA